MSIWTAGARSGRSGTLPKSERGRIRFRTCDHLCPRCSTPPHEVFGTGDRDRWRFECKKCRFVRVGGPRKREDPRSESLESREADRDRFSLETEREVLLSVSKAAVDLRRWRRSQRFSQASLARYLELGTSMVNKLERGDRKPA